MTILLPCQLYSFYVCRYYRSQRQQQHSANPNNHLICVQVLYALDLVVTCTDPIVILTCMCVCVCVCVCVCTGSIYPISISKSCCYVYRSYRFANTITIATPFNTLMTTVITQSPSHTCLQVLESRWKKILPPIYLTARLSKLFYLPCTNLYNNSIGGRVMLITR